VPDGILQDREGRVLSRGASVHVMGKHSSSALIPKLKKTDHDHQLPLSARVERVPLLGGALAGGVSALLETHRPRPVDSLSLDDVANESSHSDAAVLDLRMTEEANRGFVSLSPKVSFCEVQRVVKLDNGVG